MKVFFDTSTLVAALLSNHPQHAQAFLRLLAVRQAKLHGFLTTHGLAELFATLTALPLRPRLQPKDAQQMIEYSVLGHLKLIPLTARNYTDALALTVRQGLSSGAIYDALHLVAARSAGADALLTLNFRHFRALAPDDPLVTAP
jgi:predicted nucleic acid-binding protein